MSRKALLTSGLALDVCLVGATKSPEGGQVGDSMHLGSCVCTLLTVQVTQDLAPVG